MSRNQRSGHRLVAQCTVAGCGMRALPVPVATCGKLTDADDSIAFPNEEASLSFEEPKNGEQPQPGAARYSALVD